MAKYEVMVERKAERGLRGMDRQAAERARQAIRQLAADPRPHGTKALRGNLAGAYRLRISAPGGEYRIVWTVDQTQRLVTIIDAGPREDTY